jgi:alkylhydroperoxidase family enzyme
VNGPRAPGAAPAPLTCRPTNDMTEPIDQLRGVVAATPPPSDVLAGYLAKVRDRAYTVTDSEVDALKAAGVSEDEIFEQTVAAAIEQGLRRLDKAMEVIG